MASKFVASILRRHVANSTQIRRFQPLSTAAAVAAEPNNHHDESSSGGITMKGVKFFGRPLYLDMQATSPVDPHVLDAMLPFYISRFGNPHSRTHYYGWESDAA